MAFFLQHIDYKAGFEKVKLMKYVIQIVASVLWLIQSVEASNLDSLENLLQQAIEEKNTGSWKPLVVTTVECKFRFLLDILKD